jgi:PAS domain S-box-containing protein
MNDPTRSDRTSSSRPRPKGLTDYSRARKQNEARHDLAAAERQEHRATTEAERETRADAERARADDLATVNEALARSEARYRRVAYATNEAICDYDVPSDRLDWYEGKNAPFGHTQGAPFRTFNLAWWLAQVHAEDRGRMAALAEAAVNNATKDEQWESEYRFRRADGRYAWVRDISQLIRNADGRIVGALCSIQDLTPQREARLALEKEIEERRQAEKLARGQTETLVRALSVCAEEPSLDGFLGYVLQAIAEQLSAQGATLWIRDPQTDQPILRLCWEDGVLGCGADASHPAVLRPPCLRDDPTWQEVVRTRRPVVHEDVASDARVAPFREYLLAKGVRSLLEVPLLLGEQIIGMISIRSRTPGHYRPEEVALAQALAHQATMAIQLTHLADAAKEAAVLAERNRIAQEIHDGLAQSFTGILMQFEAAEESGVFSGRARVQAFAAQVRELARAGLAEARRSVMALRPKHARRGGLDSALRELALRSTAPGRIACTYRHFGETSIPPDQQHALFRIAQEAVSNALHHAQPEHILISLREAAQYWELYVLDDGAGMHHPLELVSQQGFGLESMRERARAIGAVWHIGTRAGEGTCITVRVPKQTPT